MLECTQDNVCLHFIFLKQKSVSGVVSLWVSYDRKPFLMAHIPSELYLNHSKETEDKTSMENFLLCYAPQNYIVDSIKSHASSGYSTAC